MRFSQVVLVPGAGWADDEGAYTRGHTWGNLCEADLVDWYLRALRDELDEAGIRNHVLPTRKRPGVPQKDRHLGLTANTLVVDCRVGWVGADDRNSQVNKSRIHVHGHVIDLATQLLEAMAHWGQIYVAHGHQGAKPSVVKGDPLLAVPGSYGVRLEPFQLNGPEAPAYASRCEELGRDIGRTIADYIIERNKAAARSG